MKATNEQIFNAAVTLMAGALAGSPFSTSPDSRLRISGPQQVQNAVKLARMIADAIED